MSAELITRLVNIAAFRPRSRLWELHELHVPLDELADNRVYEQRAIARLTGGACVAVLGPSGAGKSSMIAWTCYQLPASHFALQIPITGVEDPGSVGEIARLALSIALDEVMLDATAQDALKQSRATSQSTVRTPTRLASAKLGGGAIPAEVSLNVSSLREEFTQNRLPGDHLLALNGQLIPTLIEAGMTPIFVFDDTEATVGGADDRQRAEAFFAGPLSAFVDQVDAPMIVAVQMHLIDGSRAFARLAPGLEMITIPLLKDHARAAVAAILLKRLEQVASDTPLAAILDGTALDALAEFYRHSGGDLRRVLAAAHEAAEHAAADQAEQIGASHARFGIAQWQ